MTSLAHVDLGWNTQCTLLVVLVDQTLLGWFASLEPSAGSSQTFSLGMAQVVCIAS